MSSGALGSLNVTLSADTAQFISAMDKAAYNAERDMQRMSNSAKINSAIIATTLLAGATAFAVRMKAIVDDADHIGKMAQSLGLTVEQLSKLRYAAQLSGISIEEFNSSMAKLNKNAFDGAPVFNALGVSIRDSGGQLRNSGDILLDVADKFSKMKDGVGKASAAQEIFGRSGAQMIPLLNEGKDGIKAFADEAERLGQVIDSKTAKSAESFNDNMTRLSKSTDKFFMSIGSGLIPVLDGLVNSLTSSKKDVNNYSILIKGLALTVVSVTNSFIAWDAYIKTLGPTLRAAGDAIKAAAHGGFKEAGDIINKSSVESMSILSEAADRIQKNWDLLADKTKASSEDVSASLQKPAQSFMDFNKNMEDGWKFTETMTLKVNKFREVNDELKDSLANTFEDAIINGKKFGDVLVDLLTDIEKIILRSAVTNPLANALTAGISSFFSPSALTSQVSAFGGGVKPYTAPVFSKHGNAFQAFASGGVINGPMTFPMTGGKRGLAGEAGKEAILPLTRTASGDLGVHAQTGSNVQVNVYAPQGSKVSEERSTDGGTERINIFIDEAVANNIRSGTKTFKALKSTFGLGQQLVNR